MANLTHFQGLKLIQIQNWLFKTFQDSTRSRWRCIVFRDLQKFTSFASTDVYIFIYPMPWKIQPIRAQDYRCIFCGMQTVVFHSTFPSLLARNSLLGSIWGLLKTLQLLRTITKISDHVGKFSKLFLNTSEDFPKIVKNHKKHLKIIFEPFPKFPERFRRFLKIFRKF